MFDLELFFSYLRNNNIYVQVMVTLIIYITINQIILICVPYQSLKCIFLLIKVFVPLVICTIAGCIDNFF